MALLTREQFRDYWNAVMPGMGDPCSPLWAREDYSGGQCYWFINQRVQGWSYPMIDRYWNWCDKNCRGTVICYASSDSEEWWGFSDSDDIPLWLLRWS